MLTLDHFAADSLAQAHYFSSECQALALYYKRMGFLSFRCYAMIIIHNSLAVAYSNNFL